VQSDGAERLGQNSVALYRLAGSNTTGLALSSGTRVANDIEAWTSVQAFNEKRQTDRYQIMLLGPLATRLTEYPCRS
jgi:hypothetical protein